jgi:hypothetical protein
VKPSTKEAFAFAAVAATALAVLLSFDPLARPSMFDPATWEYNALALRDGRVPYRDFFLHKTPGAAYLGLLGAVAAEAAGQPPIVGIRCAFLALGALGPALLFLLCARDGWPRGTAILAALWLLAFEPWSLASIEGARPKVATTVLGLACLLASPRRPLISGSLGVLASLCWQPGIAFAGAAFLAVWRSGSAFESALPRSRAIARFVAGAMLPLLALAAYLAATGALGEFFAQTFLFNLHYVETGARPPIETIRRLGALLFQWNRPESFLFGLAIVGLVLRRSAPPANLGAATLAYLVLTFVSLQAWPDVILFGPGLAATMALGLFAIVPSKVPRLLALAVLGAGALGFALNPRSGRFYPPISFTAQHAAMEALGAGLARNDEVYVVSCPEFLIHTGRHSVLPWPYMWFGVDRFASSRTSGGFEGILARLDDSAPALMLVCRRWNGPLRRRFEEWSAAAYSREDTHAYPHTKRPMAVYRRRGKS